MRKLTKEQKRDIRVIAAKREEDIDFSDAPPGFEQVLSEILCMDSYCWELHIVGYSGRDNTLRVVECKSYLDSSGPGWKLHNRSHEPSRSTWLDDRRDDDANLDEVERISILGARNLVTGESSEMQDNLGWQYKSQLWQANQTRAGDPAVSWTALGIVAAGVQERETRRCESGGRDQHGRDGRQDDKCHCANALQDIAATQELRTVECRIALFQQSGLT
jgi:hypothetical protein